MHHFAFTLAQHFHHRAHHIWWNLDLNFFEWLNQFTIFISEIAELLKRVALAAFPRTDVASLTGQRWISWLHQTGCDAVFPGEIARLLTETVYRPAAASTVPPEQLQALLDATRQWIQRH
jgi:hypothetical protein